MLWFCWCWKRGENLVGQSTKGWRICSARATAAAQESQRGTPAADGNSRWVKTLSSCERLWSLFLLCASLSSLHGHVCAPNLSKNPWSWTKQGHYWPVTCACTLSACSACWDGRARDGRGERSDAWARASGGEEWWDTTAKQLTGTKRPGQAEGFPFPCDTWMKILEMSMRMPASNLAFAVRGSGPDSQEASACGQHWRLGHVDLPAHLRPLQHNLLGGIQARRTHRAVQAQLITKVQPGLSQPYSLFFRPWTNKLYPEYTLVIFPLNRNNQCKKCRVVLPLIWDLWQFFAFNIHVQGFT